MSEHTKGHLERYVDILWSPEAKQVVCICGEPEPAGNTIAYEPIQRGSKNLKLAFGNAERLKLCWNTHDELVAALEATKEFLDIPHKPEVWEALNEIVNAALAKTQPKKTSNTKQTYERR